MKKPLFPPGKAAEYGGLRYLRDNDPDDMRRNASFPRTSIAKSFLPWTIPDWKNPQCSRWHGRLMSSPVSTQKNKTMPTVRLLRSLGISPAPAGNRLLQPQVCDRACHVGARGG